jgi:hypothetical protein
MEEAYFLSGFQPQHQLHQSALSHSPLLHSRFLQVHHLPLDLARLMGPLEELIVLIVVLVQLLFSFPPP